MPAALPASNAARYINEIHTMKRKRPRSPLQTEKRKAYCIFCGSTVGQISDRTDKRVSAVYDCPKCMRNYCDQCSYEKEIGGKRFQFCLRCESKIDKVM
jgi:hypothetical protein